MGVLDTFHKYTSTMGGGAQSVGYLPLPSRSTPRPGFVQSGEVRSSSRGAGPPQRFDIQDVDLGDLSPGNSRPEDSPLPLQAIEVGARAPGFVLERPLALASEAVEQATGTDPLAQLGQFGPFKLAGDVINNISRLVPALNNKGTIETLAQGYKEGWSDDRVVQTDFLAIPSDFGDDPRAAFRQAKEITWAEFKADARARGFTEQDIFDYLDGRKGAFDYGDRAMFADPMAELVASLAYDPLNFLFGAGMALKVGKGVGLLSKAIRAGAVTEKPLRPLLASEAWARGLSKGGTWMGLATYFGEAARGAPGFLRGGLGLAGQGLDAAAAVGGAYKKLALATTGTQLAVGAVDRATAGFRGGFMEGLFQANREIWDNQPLSQNSAFMVMSAFGWHPKQGLLRVKDMVGKAKTRAFGSPMKKRVIDALREGESWGAKKPSRQAVLEAFGGEENLENLIVHTHANMVFERLMQRPSFKKMFQNISSAPEAFLLYRKAEEMVLERLANEYRKGGGFLTPEATVERLKKWYGFRSGIDQGGVPFQWDGKLAIDRWVEYGAAVSPVARAFREGSDVVIGLVDEMLAEDIANMRSVLKMGLDNGQREVSVLTLRQWMSRFPQLTQDPWFRKYNLPEWNGKSVPAGRVLGKLRRLERDAPTARSITHEFATAERAAAQADIVQHLDTPGVSVKEGGTILAVSRMRSEIAERLGINSNRVDDIMASRNAPEIAAFENRLAEAMEEAGFSVDEVSQAIGGWADEAAGLVHEPSLEVVMSRGTVPEIRLAAALLGRAGDQDAVIWAVSGPRIQGMGLTPNGYEARVALPSTSRAQLQAVSEILAREVGDRGYTINDAKGIVRILRAGANEDDLADTVRRVVRDIEGLYPKDAVGDSGVAYSVHPAYVELITRKKESYGQATYNQVLRDARRSGDARAGLADALKDRLSYRRGAEANVASRLGPDEAVGRQSGDAGPVPGADYSLSPSEKVDFGRDPVADQAIEPGYVYHVSSPDLVRQTADDGLRALRPEGKWSDGGTGRRLYFVDESLLPSSLTEDGVVYRVRREDAGRLRASAAQEGELFATKRIPPSLIEVYGADGQWYRLDQWFPQPIEPNIASAARSVAQASQQATEGPFSPSVDPLTAGLRALEDEAWQARGVPGDEAQLASELARLTQATELSDEVLGQAQDVQRRLEATRLAKGEVRRGQVLYQAQRDAVSASQVPFHRSLNNLVPDDVKLAELEAFERRLRANYPMYTLKKAPNAAILLTEHGSLLNRYLRDRTWLGNTIVDDLFGKPARLVNWLLTGSNEFLAKEARQALANELIPHGATPKQIEAFIGDLREEVRMHRIPMRHDVQIYRNISALPSFTIDSIAQRHFTEKTIQAIGRDGFHRALDRASNRFIRTMNTYAAKGGKRGRLARSVVDAFSWYQKTAVGEATRLVSKTFYHLFRFLVDIRWHAMNQLEADIIGFTKYGIRGSDDEISQAMRVHQKVSPQARDFDGDMGWLYGRHVDGKISRVFDAKRPETTLTALRSMADDEVYRGLKQIVQIEDAKAGRTVRTPAEITDEDIVQAIDRMLYDFDTKGVRETIVDEAVSILGEKETERLMPFLQKVWEAHDATFQSIVQTFTGNPNRSNLERIMNSYWLYWPISYQIKATKWLVDTLFDGAFGADTGAAGAALYANAVEQHRERLRTNPAYAQMFSDHPTTWFLAQMLVPITPGDIGVSLSRPVRLIGGELGLWAKYRQAEDPISAALYILEMGPIYTARLLQRFAGEYEQ